MLLKVVIFYVVMIAVFADDSFDEADSSDYIEGEDYQNDLSEETTEGLVPFPSDSISSLETTLVEINASSKIDLNSEATDPSFLGNKGNEAVVTTPLTIIANDTNLVKPSNLTHNYRELGAPEITNGKWANSSGNVEGEDDLTDLFVETTEGLLPLPSDSISSFEKRLIEINDPGKTDLASLNTNPPSSGNQNNEVVVTTPVTTITNDANLPKPGNLTDDNSSKLGPHEITYGKWDDSSANVKGEDDLANQFEETTEGLLPLPSDSISSLEKSLIETNAPGNTDLASVNTNPPSSGNQNNEAVVTTTVTTITNDTNLPKPGKLTDDNSSKLGPHEITYGKWVGLPNGRHSSFTSIKGGLNYGAEMYNKGIPRFSHSNYGTWKGTPYTEISYSGPVNQGKMFENAHPMNNFRDIMFHGVNIPSNSPKINNDNMRGDMYSEEDSWGYAFGSFYSGIPFTQEYSQGRWTPMYRSRTNKFSGESFGNWKPLAYGHMFRNFYPMHHSWNSFEYGTSGNLEGHSFGGHDLGMSYGEHLPASEWK